jgi:hypothetical protein
MLMKKSALQVMAALMLFAVPGAMACPLCANSLQLTISAQELIYAEHSALAMPVPERNEFQVVALIKGDAPPGNTINIGDVFRPALKTDKPLLLIRDKSWRQWVNFGSINADRADWLRQLSMTKRNFEMNDAEWREHVAYFLPYLENAELMVAEIAYNELARAPYSALRSLKPRLDAAVVRAWLKDPKLAARQPTYLLLLGIAGTAQDGRWLAERIEIARTTHTTANLPALLGAYIELRGPAGVEQVQKLYLADSSRTKPEIEAALVALKVHGESDSVACDRVNEALKDFIKQNPSLANLVSAGPGETEIRIAPVSAAR